MLLFTEDMFGIGSLDFSGFTYDHEEANVRSIATDEHRLIVSLKMRLFYCLTPDFESCQDFTRQEMTRAY
jgi:hypothetical protein